MPKKPSPQPTYPRKVVHPKAPPPGELDDGPDEPQFIELRRTTPYSAEVLERPVYGYRDGKLVRVADRLRDILTPEDIAAAGGSLPPDPRLAAGPPPADPA